MSGPGAFLALWNSLSAPALQAEYEHWHTFEHVPERVGLPGFIEARRYRSLQPNTTHGTPDYFTCYWVDDLGAFSTDDYTGIFAKPTPWTARMRVELRDFFRLTCAVSGRFGQGSASQLATLHFKGDASSFREAIDAQLTRLVDRGDLVCAQWGSAALTAAIPIANQLTSHATGDDFVVMLQSLEADSLQRHADELVAAIALVVTLASPPKFFEGLTQIRQDELSPPYRVGQRQPQRTDLFQRFFSGDTP